MEKSNKGRIIKDALKYTSAGYFSNVFGMVTAIAVRKILGPTLMGIFSELMLIFEYAKNNHFGILHALDREVPIYNGKKDFDKVKTLGDIGFSFCLLSSILVSLVIIFVIYFLRGNYDPRLFFGMLVITILLIIQPIVSLYTVFIRTHHNFLLLSKYIIFIAPVDMLLKIVLAIKFGIYGVLWAFVLSATVSYIYLRFCSNFRFRFVLKLPKAELAKLIKVGFPILLGGLVFTTLCSIDRFFIIKFLTKTELGYYSIATMLHEFILLLPNLVSVVLFPRFYEKFGKKNNILDLRGDYALPTLIFAYLLPIVIGSFVLLLPILLNYFLPKFWLGLIPATILVFGTFFLTTLNMSGYLLVALNKQYQIIIIAFINILISMALNYLFVRKLNLGLNGVALAMLFTYLAYSTMLVSRAFSHYTKKIKDHLNFFIELYSPIVWTAFVIYTINKICVYDFSSASKDASVATLRIIILVIAYVPVFGYVHRKTKILNDAFYIIKERFLGKPR